MRSGQLARHPLGLSLGDCRERKSLAACLAASRSDAIRGSDLVSLALSPRLRQHLDKVAGRALRLFMPLPVPRSESLQVLPEERDGVPEPALLLQQ